MLWLWMWTMISWGCFLFVFGDALQLWSEEFMSYPGVCIILYCVRPEILHISCSGEWSFFYGDTRFDWSTDLTSKEKSDPSVFAERSCYHIMKEISDPSLFAERSCYNIMMGRAVEGVDAVFGISKKFRQSQQLFIYILSTSWSKQKPLCNTNTT